jgi:hypothetical protein
MVALNALFPIIEALMVEILLILADNILEPFIDAKIVDVPLILEVQGADARMLANTLEVPDIVANKFEAAFKLADIVDVPLTLLFNKNLPIIAAVVLEVLLIVVALINSIPLIAALTVEDELMPANNVPLLNKLAETVDEPLHIALIIPALCMVADIVEVEFV